MQAIKIDGDLVIKTLAMPNDTNAAGDIFGGWVLSQMDLGGGIVAKSISPYGRAVTASIESMSFINPIAVGELVSCYAKIVYRGKTSLKVQLEVWTYNYRSNITKKVTQGIFTYVAVDEQGKPVKLLDKESGITCLKKSNFTTEK